MKTLLLSLVMILNGSAAFAATSKKAPSECVSYARNVLRAAMHGPTAKNFPLQSVDRLQVYNTAADSNETVERITFASEAAQIVVDTFPSYYKKGECQLKGVTITRD